MSNIGLLEERVVLVTGTMSGIGQATTTFLAVNTASASLGPDGTRLERQDTGFSLLPLDVTSEPSVAACVSDVVAQAGRIDVLINNAGWGCSGR